MNKYINKFNKRNEDELRKMQNKHPKENWKILNSLKSNKQQNNPDPEDMYKCHQCQYL